MKYDFAHRMNGIKASVIREILKFTADPSVISFAAGNPSPEAFPVEAVQKITADILAENPIAALQYGVSEGYAPLRSAISDDLKIRHSISNPNDQLIITSGAQQAIEIACKVLCNPNDVILCERPSFIGSLNSFKSYDTKLVGVDIENDGICIEKLEQAFEQNDNIKMLYLIPNFQNPTGITMSLEKRKKCYELCLKHNVIILEDNPYGELRFNNEAIPSIKSFDTENIVIYCGSFSKLLAPGLRVGYAVAPSEIAQKMVVCKQSSDVHTNLLGQMICHKFMTEFDFVEHIQKLQSIYRHKANLMLEQIDTHLHKSIEFTRTDGGLFIWCNLPDNVDMNEFCTTAIENKVAIVPGNAFLPNENEVSHSFRLNFSTPTDDEIVKGVEILGKLSNELC